jgi:exportin-T
MQALAMPVEENDEDTRQEVRMLQRIYFQFIATIVTNNVTEVLEMQESEALEQVMTSIIRGATDFPDPLVSHLNNALQCDAKSIYLQGNVMF